MTRPGPPRLRSSFLPAALGRGSWRCPFLPDTSLDALRGFWGRHSDSEGGAETEGGEHSREWSGVYFTLWSKPGLRAAPPLQLRHVRQLTVFPLLFLLLLFLQTKNSEGEFSVTDNRKKKQTNI